MRDFYRTYENHPALLSRAKQLGWIQNVVIMEAELTMELREWYLNAAKQFDWSKTELSAKIASQTHLEMVLDNGQEVCYSINDKRSGNAGNWVVKLYRWFRQFIHPQKIERGVVPWHTMCLPIFTAKRIVFMRC